MAKTHSNRRVATAPLAWSPDRLGPATCPVPGHYAIKLGCRPMIGRHRCRSSSPHGSVSTVWPVPAQTLRQSQVSKQHLLQQSSRPSKQRPLLQARTVETTVLSRHRHGTSEQRPVAHSRRGVETTPLSRRRCSVVTTLQLLGLAVETTASPASPLYDGVGQRWSVDIASNRRWPSWATSSTAVRPAGGQSRCYPHLSSWANRVAQPIARPSLQEGGPGARVLHARDVLREHPCAAAVAAVAIVGNPWLPPPTTSSSWCPALLLAIVARLLHVGQICARSVLGGFLIGIPDV